MIIVCVRVLDILINYAYIFLSTFVIASVLVLNQERAVTQSRLNVVISQNNEHKSLTVHTRITFKGLFEVIRHYSLRFQVIFKEKAVLRGVCVF